MNFVVDDSALDEELFQISWPLSCIWGCACDGMRVGVSSSSSLPMFGLFVCHLKKNWWMPNRGTRFERGVDIFWLYRPDNEGAYTSNPKKKDNRTWNGNQE